jgi:hypothetical protein
MLSFSNEQALVSQQHHPRPIWETIPGVHPSTQAHSTAGHHEKLVRTGIRCNCGGYSGSFGFALCSFLSSVARIGESHKRESKRAETHAKYARAWAVAARYCPGMAAQNAAISAVREQPAAVMRVSIGEPFAMLTCFEPSVTCTTSERHIQS